MGKLDWYIFFAKALWCVIHTWEFFWGFKEGLKEKFRNNEKVGFMRTSGLLSLDFYTFFGPDDEALLFF